MSDFAIGIICSTVLLSIGLICDYLKNRKQ